MPVIPDVSENVLLIYQMGIKLGNNPSAFSKVGDCESRTSWYLADFDLGEMYYSLGEYSDLQEVIDYFAGSYERLSLAAKPGFTAASLLSPLWADREYCESTENPLVCEYREHRPSFSIITLGTNDVVKVETFEENMRRVIDTTIDFGIVPILATKADNLEGDHEINEIIARLAYEYDIPLWNFWLAVQLLPRHGLQADQAHLTWASNRFGDSRAMQNAWPVRNLTALQVLDVMLQNLGE
ncbi:MAG: SGNH/GDSL hydrolase family protein [Anaerolineaceae bacterium]|nr:SGNH/GDSL hydrolase family protein [Anaerolineaceae bacterium]